MMIKNFLENVQKYAIRLLGINKHKLIGINKHMYFLKGDDNDELFIMADVHKNKSFVL